MSSCEDNSFAKVDTIGNKWVFKGRCMENVDSIKFQPLVRIFGCGRGGNIRRGDLNNFLISCAKICTFLGNKQLPDSEKSNQHNKCENIGDRPIALRHM